MPQISPAKSHKQGLVALVNLIDRWWAEDPVRAASLPGGGGLRRVLVSIVEEIEASLVFVNKRELTADETNALFYLANLWAARLPEDPGATLAGFYLQQLASQVTLLKMPDSHVASHPLYQTTRLAKRVFLVCGRAREPMLEMERWLKSLGLEIVVLESASVAGSQPVPTALEDKVAGCGTALVLATADDTGRLASGKEAFKARARQNVILELGLLWGLLGTQRIVVVMDEKITTDFPTDASGFMTIRFRDHVREAFDGVRTKLQEMGVISTVTIK
jgi:predicted nucleotide-binding protein